MSALQTTLRKSVTKTNRRKGFMGYLIASSYVSTGSPLLFQYFS
jgi:hypothetical protein